MNHTYATAKAPAALAFQQFQANRRAAQQQRESKRLKRWIWIYFWLLIFEGALRKWFLPALSSPLLLVRDPVALIIYYLAYRCGKFSMKKAWPFAVLAAALGLLACAQIAGGVVSIPIALFGLRSYVLHPYLIFVMADTLDADDLHEFGRWILLLSVPMFFLVLLQFKAPASSILNAGAGENSGQALAALGHVRPAGTWSFISGPVNYMMLLGAFLLDGLMRRGRYPAWLLYSALFATVGMIPILGSRMVIFTLAGLGVFTALSGVSHGARLIGFTKIVVVLLLVGVVALQFPFFTQGIKSFEARWEEASHNEGDVWSVLDKRVFSGFRAGAELATSVPLLGNGIGMGSSFAAVTLGGTAEFIAGETEWERVMYEFGPLFGVLFLGARIAFAVYVFLQALRALKGKAVLAWLLFPMVGLLLVITIMEQTTYLGFMVMSGGLCLAAARTERGQAPFYGCASPQGMQRRPSPYPRGSAQ